MAKIRKSSKRSVIVQSGRSAKGASVTAEGEPGESATATGKAGGAARRAARVPRRARRAARRRPSSVKIQTTDH